MAKAVVSRIAIRSSLIALLAAERPQRNVPVPRIANGADNGTTVAWETIGQTSMFWSRKLRAKPLGQQRVDVRACGFLQRKVDEFVRTYHRTANAQHTCSGATR